MSKLLVGPSHLESLKNGSLDRGNSTNETAFSRQEVADEQALAECAPGCCLSDGTSSGRGLLQTG